MSNEVLQPEKTSIPVSAWERALCRLSSLLGGDPYDIQLEIRDRTHRGEYQDSFSHPRFNASQFDGSIDAYWNMVRGILGIPIPEKE